MRHLVPHLGETDDYNFTPNSNPPSQGGRGQNPSPLVGRLGWWYYPKAPPMIASAISSSDKPNISRSTISLCWPITGAAKRGPWS